MQTYYLIQVSYGGLQDTYAAAALSTAIDLAQPDATDWLEARYVEAVDAGAARLLWTRATPFRLNAPWAWLGVYGDGGFGHQHTRNACAALLDATADRLRRAGRIVPSVTATVSVWDLAQELRGDSADDLSAEYDGECWLNEVLPFRDAYWGWRDGDFGLWLCEEDDGHEALDLDVALGLTPDEMARASERIDEWINKCGL